MEKKKVQIIVRTNSKTAPPKVFCSHKSFETWLKKETAKENKKKK